MLSTTNSQTNPIIKPPARGRRTRTERSEEHTSELQSPCNLVCRLLLEKKKKLLLIHSAPLDAFADTAPTYALRPQARSRCAIYHNHCTVTMSLVPRQLPDSSRLCTTNR